MFMFKRCMGPGLVAAVLLMFAGACGKSRPTDQKKAETTQPPQSPSASAGAAALSGDTVARIHWLGKKRLAGETNAAHFMSIWNLPESAKLEAQTLDKLAVAPWRLLLGDTNLTVTNTPASLLRPLLDDLVQEESYLELRHPTNQPGALAFAIRLSAERAALWETNLASVIGAVPGIRPAPGPAGAHAWQLQTTNGPSTAPGFLQLTRAGEWTVLGVGQDSNPVFSDVLARVQRDHAPFPARATNFWLEADLDLRGAVAALSLGWKLPKDLPAVALTLIGDGENVRTRGELKFPEPQSWELEPWNIPTNLIHDPLIGFSAIRGIRPWLKSFKPWNDLHLGTPPNQAFFWAQSGGPLHFVAVPSSEASNQVNTITELVIDKINPLSATSKMRVGKFEPMTNSPGLLWRGIPFFSPNLSCADLDGTPFIIGGFFGNKFTTRPMPHELLQQFSASKDLLWYDWEITQPCLEGLTQVAQLARHVIARARMTSTPGLRWLIAISSKLANSGTAVRVLDPTRLSVTRNSTVGLTGAELQIFADWLESPDFPRGLHTFLAPVDSVPPEQMSESADGVSTNAPSATHP